MCTSEHYVVMRFKLDMPGDGITPTTSPEHRPQGHWHDMAPVNTDCYALAADGLRCMLPDHALGTEHGAALEASAYLG